MRKGQRKRVWTPEQKSEIVYTHLDDHISVRTLEREYTADRSRIYSQGSSRQSVCDFACQQESVIQIAKGISSGLSQILTDEPNRL